MATTTCPLCKKECEIVSKHKAFEFLKKHFEQHLKSKKYGFCENTECDIVYFGLESDEMYFKRDLDDDTK